MTVTPKDILRAWPILTGMIALVLIAFAAARSTGPMREARQAVATQTTVGTASEKPAAGPKERVRYQGTIENWRRYRQSTNSH
jgi:hypothetical protein